MGTFDNITAGERHGQTKAFGASLGNITLGDRVAISELGEDLYGSQPPTQHGDGQVNVSSGGWLIVRDGIWVEWADEPAPDLPRFDNTGARAADDYERYPHDPTAT